MTGSEKREIARTKEQSASLPRELRLIDLAFLQVLLIMGLPWVGYAAREGGSHVYFWLLAIPLFYLPLAGTVIYLSRRLPLEGGIYQWTKIGLGPFAGFQSAWNYSFFLILLYANSGSLVANSLSYLLGPQAAWMTSHKPLLFALNIVFFGLVFLVNVLGLHLARWVTSAGGAIVIGLYLLLVALLLARLLSNTPVVQPTLSLAFPAVTLLSVNLFSKIAFNALSGFEQVAIFAGECQTPERNIARSVWIAAPGIALLYILGSCALLAYTPKDQIDLIAPIPQILGASFGVTPLAAFLGGAAILALLFAYFTQAVACVAQVSRLPMVAGWDGLLPAGLSALHPRYRTPVRSLVIVVAACICFGAASLFQVGEQEATQILVAAGMACAGFYYLMMFAVVLWGKWDGQEKAPWWLRIAACAAAAVTVLSVSLQVVPILDVARPGVFAAKVAGAVAIINAAGCYIYLRGRRKSVAMRAATS